MLAEYYVIILALGCFQTRDVATPYIHPIRYRYLNFEYCITDTDSDIDTCQLELMTNDCVLMYTVDQKCRCISIKFYKILQNTCRQMVSGIFCIYTIDTDNKFSKGYIANTV